MKILYSWLKEFVDVDLSPKELAQKLVELGTEVACVETVGADFEGVFVAQIKKIEAHPNSDHLHLVELDLGDGKLQRVVCGAPNVAVGQKVPLAKVGARLGKEVLKPAQIRGVASEGMICSSDELGLTATRQRGIMVLDDTLKLGTDVSDLYGKPDSVFELEVTSNRPDLLSHLGVARELAVLLDKPVKLPQPKELKAQGEALKVKIEDDDACPRYAGRIIRGVKNVESPEYIKTRLSAMGLNPKNALVDITNYVMFELGNPLHAFDRTEIDGDTIVVRRAQENEKFTLLNGRELELNTNALLITDGKKATALAGIMGGQDSGIKEDTSDIFIEAAYFDAPTTNKTSKKFMLSSDAAQRFERGTDIEGALLALKRASELFVEICGGTPSEIVDVYPVKFENPVVSFTPVQINAILGTSIEDEKLKAIFGRLAAKFDASGASWTFQAPTHRRDLNHRWDLAEEAARFVGFDAIPLGQNQAKISFADNPKGIDLTRQFSTQLIGLGFYECKNLDFLGQTELKAFGFEPKYAIKIKNAMAQGWDYLRPTLLPALLKNVEFNQDRGQKNVALFEATKTFSLIKSFPVETYTVAGVLTGTLEREPFFEGGGRPVDFYFLKGVVEQLISGFDKVKLEPAKNAPIYMHPKISMDIVCEGKKIGILGKIHPLTLKSFGVKTTEVWAFELSAKQLEKAFSAQEFKPINTPEIFQSSFRDLSVLVDKALSYAQLSGAFPGVLADINIQHQLIDLYQGERLPEGKKSVTFSLAFSNPQRTLKDAEIDQCFNQIVAQLNAKTGATLR